MLNSHPDIAESAVVGYPHDLKGQGIFAYVILNSGAVESDALRADNLSHVRKEIGPIASPDVLLITLKPAQNALQNHASHFAQGGRRCA